MPPLSAKVSIGMKLKLERVVPKVAVSSGTDIAEIASSHYAAFGVITIVKKVSKVNGVKSMIV